jgi:hypothetical protein
MIKHTSLLSTFPVDKLNWFLIENFSVIMALVIDFLWNSRFVKNFKDFVNNLTELSHPPVIIKVGEFE